MRQSFKQAAMQKRSAQPGGSYRESVRLEAAEALGEMPGDPHAASREARTTPARGMR